MGRANFEAPCLVRFIGAKKRRLSLHSGGGRRCLHQHPFDPPIKKRAPKDPFKDTEMCQEETSNENGKLTRLKSVSARRPGT